jgi:hypothetical protein
MITLSASGQRIYYPFSGYLLRYKPKIAFAFYIAFACCFALMSVLSSGVSLLSIVLCVCGIYTWTFFEYMFHRFVFRLPSIFSFAKKPGKGSYTLESVPNEKVFPATVMDLILLLFFVSLIYAISGAHSFSLMTGVCFGFLRYAYIRYKLYRKPNKFMFYKLRQHQLLRRKKYPDKAFGISSLFWDQVFRTMPPQ